MGAVILVFLILFNASFVIVEMALVSSRRARLESMAAKGHRGARAALRLLDNPTGYLSTVQVGITVAGVLMGAFGEDAVAERLAERLREIPAIAPYAHAIALTVTVFTLTLVIIVAGELVPKRLAQIAPETFACLGARPMWAISRIAAPIVWLLSRSTNLILKLVPIRARPSEEHVVEDVKALVATGAEAGVLHKTEQQLVERVFKLSDLGVKALMVPRTDVQFLLIDDPIARVRAVAATSSHSHFPICKTGLDDLIGVVHIKDLVRRGLIAGADEPDGGDLGTGGLAQLVQPPLFVPESTPAIKMLETFRNEKTHIAFVLDEYGVLEGLVTLYDVIEALVGEVTRRGDVEDPSIVARGDGSYLLDGMLSVAELRDLLKVEELPHEKMAGYETLGGLIMTYLGRIPATGDNFTWNTFKFEVVDMDKARVDKVMVTIPQPAPAPQI